MVGSGPDFDEDEAQRSAFIRQLTLRQLGKGPEASPSILAGGAVPIPRTLVRFWDTVDDVPHDVRECLDSWEPLRREGFSLLTFDDRSAAAYIGDRYGPRELAAYAECRHPAMRSDYLRLCFVLADGGLYVDADDVLVSAGWKEIFRDGRLKVQALGYDVAAQAMLNAADLREASLDADDRIFYVNNNPLAAPPGHPVLRRALGRATDRLLDVQRASEIQSIAGPGNLTAALAAHAYERQTIDFELLLDWESTAEPCWELEYRNDRRNWRNVYSR